jgi:hypothetical protein
MQRAAFGELAKQRIQIFSILHENLSLVVDLLQRFNQDRDTLEQSQHRVFVVGTFGLLDHHLLTGRP